MSFILMPSMQSGMMQGWGRPALLVANNRTDLPSDFLGEFCIFYEPGNYLRKITQLIETFKDREPYYVSTLAVEAVDVVDYEKAIKYLQAKACMFFITYFWGCSILVRYGLNFSSECYLKKWLPGKIVFLSNSISIILYMLKSNDVKTLQ